MERKGRRITNPENYLQIFRHLSLKSKGQREDNPARKRTCIIHLNGDLIDNLQAKCLRKLITTFPTRHQSLQRGETILRYLKYEKQEIDVYENKIPPYKVTTVEITYQWWHNGV